MKKLQSAAMDVFRLNLDLPCKNLAAAQIEDKSIANRKARP